MDDILATDAPRVEIGDPDAARYGTCKLGHARTVMLTEDSGNKVAALWCPVCQKEE